MTLAEMQQLAGQIAFWLGFLTCIPYIFDMIRGKAKPPRSTWIIISTVNLVILLASTGKLVGNASQQLGYLIGSTATMVAAIKYGIGGWSSRDKRCFAAAAVALILRLAANQVNLAFTLGLLLNAIGIYPLIRKLWEGDLRESKMAWTICLIGSLVNLGTITADYKSVVYIFYMIACNGLIVWPLYRRKRKETA